MLDDLEQSAKYAMRDSLRGSDSFMGAFKRYFKERLIFSLVLTLVSLGIIVIVVLYVAFVVLRHM